MSGKGYSHKERWLILKILEEGCTVREAALEVGRPYHGLRAALLRWKIGKRQPGTRPDAAKRSRLLGLIGLGHRLAECARILGLHVSGVHRMAQQMARDGLLRTKGSSGKGLFYLVKMEYGNDEFD